MGRASRNAQRRTVDPRTGLTRIGPATASDRYPSPAPSPDDRGEFLEAWLTGDASGVELTLQVWRRGDERLVLTRLSGDGRVDDEWFRLDAAGAREATALMLARARALGFAAPTHLTAAQVLGAIGLHDLPRAA